MLEWSLHSMPPERQRHHPDQLMLQAFLSDLWLQVCGFSHQLGHQPCRRKLYIPTSCQLWPQNSGVVWKTWCKNWRTTEKLKTPDSRPSLSNISDPLTTWVSAFKNASEFAAAICCGVSAFVVQLAETPVGFVSHRATTGHWLLHTAVVRPWLQWTF